MLLFLISFRVDGLHCILITDRDGVPVLKGTQDISNCVQCISIR